MGWVGCPFSDLSRTIFSFGFPLPKPKSLLISAPASLPSWIESVRLKVPLHPPIDTCVSFVLPGVKLMIFLFQIGFTPV